MTDDIESIKRKDFKQIQQDYNRNPFLLIWLSNQKERIDKEELLDLIKNYKIDVLQNFCIPNLLLPNVLINPRHATLLTKIDHKYVAEELMRMIRMITLHCIVTTKLKSYNYEQDDQVCAVLEQFIDDENNDILQMIEPRVLAERLIAFQLPKQKKIWNVVNTRKDFRHDQITVKDSNSMQTKTYHCILVSVKEPTNDKKDRQKDHERDYRYNYGGDYEDNYEDNYKSDNDTFTDVYDNQKDGEEIKLNQSDVEIIHLGNDMSLIWRKNRLFVNHTFGSGIFSDLFCYLIFQLLHQHRWKLIDVKKYFETFISSLYPLVGYRYVPDDFLFMNVAYTYTNIPECRKYLSTQYDQLLQKFDEKRFKNISVQLQPLKQEPKHFQYKWDWYDDEATRLTYSTDNWINHLCYIRFVCKHWAVNKIKIDHKTIRPVLKFLVNILTDHSQYREEDLSKQSRILSVTFHNLCKEYIKDQIVHYDQVMSIIDIINGIKFDDSKERITKEMIPLFNKIMGNRSTIVPHELQGEYTNLSFIIIIGLVCSALSPRYNESLENSEFLVKHLEMDSLPIGYGALSPLRPINYYINYSPLELPTCGDMSNVNPIQYPAGFHQEIDLPYKVQQRYMKMVRRHFFQLQFHHIPQDIKELYLSICTNYMVELQIHHVHRKNYSFTTDNEWFQYGTALLLCRNARINEEVIFNTIYLPFKEKFSIDKHWYFIINFKSSIYKIQIMSYQNITSKMIHHIHITPQATSMEHPELVLDEHNRWTFQKKSCLTFIKNPLPFQQYLHSYGYFICTERSKQKGFFTLRFISLKPRMVPSHTWTIEGSKWYYNDSVWYIDLERVQNDPLRSWHCVNDSRGISCLLYHRIHQERRGLLVVMGNAPYSSPFQQSFDSRINTNLNWSILEFTKNYNWFLNLSCDQIKLLYHVVRSNHLPTIIPRVTEIFRILEPDIFGSSYINNLHNHDASHMIDPKDRWINQIRQHYQYFPSDDIVDFWKSMGGLTPNDKQVKLIEEIERAAKTNRNCVVQSIMGSGKSSVIMPYLLIHFLEKNPKPRYGLYVIVVQPKHLVEAAIQRIANLAFIPWVIIRKSHSKKKEEYRFVRKPGYVIIDVLDDLELKQIWQLKPLGSIRDRYDMMIMDEYDSIAMPCKSDYNICKNVIKGYSAQEHELKDVLYWFRYEMPKLLFRCAKKVEWERLWNMEKKKHPLYQTWFHIYKTVREKWIYKSKYGFRSSGSKKSPFVVPFIASNIPHESSEFSSNDVNFIATCVAMTHEPFLLPWQQKQISSINEREIKLGIVPEIDDQRIYWLTYCLYEELSYTTEMTNINMTDILHKKEQQKGIIYAFSGTVAIPTEGSLGIVCVTPDLAYNEILQLLTRADLIENDIKSVGKFDVLIDAFGYFKDYTLMETLELLWKELNERNIVFVNEYNQVMVYQEKSISPHPYNNRDSNSFTNDDGYFYYFDHAHTIGTDVRHPSGLNVLVMTHETNREFQIVQAMYRIRGLHMYNHKVTFGTKHCSSDKSKQLQSMIFQWQKNQEYDKKNNKDYLTTQLERFTYKLNNGNYKIDLSKGAPMDAEQEKDQEKEQEIVVEQVRNYIITEPPKDLRIISNYISIKHRKDIIYDPKGSIEIRPGVILSAYAHEYVQQTKEPVYDVFIIEDSKSNQQFLIHFNEVMNILPDLNSTRHILYHSLGYRIYPNEEPMERMDLAILLHLSTVTFDNICSLVNDPLWTLSNLELRKNYQQFQILLNQNRKLSEPIMFLKRESKAPFFSFISKSKQIMTDYNQKVSLIYPLIQYMITELDKLARKYHF